MAGSPSNQQQFLSVTAQALKARLWPSGAPIATDDVGEIFREAARRLDVEIPPGLPLLDLAWRVAEAAGYVEQSTPALSFAGALSPGSIYGSPGIFGSPAGIIVAGDIRMDSPISASADRRFSAPASAKRQRIRPTTPPRITPPRQARCMHHATPAGPSSGAADSAPGAAGVVAEARASDQQPKRLTPPTRPPQPPQPRPRPPQPRPRPPQPQLPQPQQTPQQEPPTDHLDSCMWIMFDSSGQWLAKENIGSSWATYSERQIRDRCGNTGVNAHMPDQAKADASRGQWVKISLPGGFCRVSKAELKRQGLKRASDQDSMRYCAANAAFNVASNLGVECTLKRLKRALPATQLCAGRPRTFCPAAQQAALP